MSFSSKATTQGHDGCSIAVVGGGISGLAAAHRILELKPDARVSIFESSNRLGGVLHTERRDGYLIEHGADNFITTPSWAVDFCQRIGFEKELIETNDTNRRAFVVRRGKLRPIPTGFAVMAPSRIWPIISTPILSMRGKLRMAGELFVRRRPDNHDESLAAFVRRRLGNEAYERLVQPLVAGIYTGDPEQLSVGLTMPRFLQMEQDHGSLIRAMWKQRKQQRSSSKQSSGARYSQFVAPRDGMSSLVQATVSKLTNAAIHLDSPVERLTLDDGSSWRLSVGGKQQSTINTDGVILAAPAYYCSSLMQSIDPTLADELAKIQYGSCALVTLGFQREQIGHALDGFGCVVPAVEQRRILSISFSSIKYAGRAPDGQVLLRVFVGGAFHDNLLRYDDQQLKKLVLQELSQLLAIRGTENFSHLVRQYRGMPQYYVGHQEIIQHIEKRAAKLPNFAIAGNSLHGIGIPSCIHTGELASGEFAGELPYRGKCGISSLSDCFRCTRTFKVEI